MNDQINRTKKGTPNDLGNLMMEWYSNKHIYKVD